MPKIKWGGDITAADIDEAEVREGRYAGEIPPSGVYKFKLQSMKFGQSKEGNPKLAMIWKVDGSWRPEHKKYNGAPLFDHMPVTKATAFKAKALCAALGVSSADFTNKSITDDEGFVTKIGKLVIDEGLTIYASVTREANESYGARLINPGYMAPDDDADDDADDDSDDDADDSTPF